MGGFVVRTHVQNRDHFGRFLAEYNANAARAVADTAEAIALEARANAPKRTGQLAASIYAVPHGKSATIETHNDHAAPQEFGAGPHDIPNAFGWGITVHHPGNPATHFLKRAVANNRDRFVAAVRRAIP